MLTLNTSESRISHWVMLTITDSTLVILWSFKLFHRSSKRKSPHCLQMNDEKSDMCAESIHKHMMHQAFKKNILSKQTSFLLSYKCMKSFKVNIKLKSLFLPTRDHFHHPINFWWCFVSYLIEKYVYFTQKIFDCRMHDWPMAIQHSWDPHNNKELQRWCIFVGENLETSCILALFPLMFFWLNSWNKLNFHSVT